MNWLRFVALLSAASAISATPTVIRGDAIQFGLSNLPPRSVPEYPTARPVPSWLRTHLRVAHLPPVQWRQVDEFLKEGYNVVTANMMQKWDHVGPTAHIYTSD